MSRQFSVTKIEVVTSDFTYKRGGKFPCQATVKKGTVIATGPDGYYLYNPTFGKDPKSINDPACWPKPENGKIRLYRDYWKFGYEFGPDSVVTRSAVELAHIRSPKKTVSQAR